MRSKKHLAEKVSPVALVNAIKGKHKEAGITEKPSSRKNPQNQQQMLFTTYISMPARPGAPGQIREGVEACAEYSNKKQA